MNRLEYPMECTECEKIGERGRAKEAGRSIEEFERHGTIENARRHTHFASVCEFACVKGHHWQEKQYSRCWCGWHGTAASRDT